MRRSHRVHAHPGTVGRMGRFPRGSGTPAEGRPVAVIDIGSNSGRLVVFRYRDGGHLDVLEDDRVALRLARSITDGSRLADDAIERTVQALLDFRAVASGAGVAHTVAVATAAVRDVENANELVERAKVEVGIDLTIIDADEEARYGFLGAVHDLPAVDGLTMDVGGGSVEFARFRQRQLEAAWTLPFGALRASDRFLVADPPTPKEQRQLTREVVAALAGTGVPTLGAAERLVGIGGTVRNLARMDRRRTEYPLPLLHGYGLPRDRLDGLARLLSERTLRQRTRLGGLNPDRADSIVGGALVVLAVMEAVGATDLLVSGRGLREGVALDALGSRMPSPRQVRAASVGNLARRFTTWDPMSASRRGRIAATLLTAAVPDAPDDVREMLAHASTIVDAGRALDYYDRFEHAAGIVVAADLGGFGHEDVAILTTILHQAGEGGRTGPFRVLVPRELRDTLSAAAVVLTLADEIDRRLPADRSADDVRVAWLREGLVVSVPVTAAWRPREVSERFRRVFHRPLLIEAGERHPTTGPLT